MTHDELRAHRARLRLTQAQLGHAIGRHPNTMAQYERGELPIPPVVRLAIDALRAQKHNRRKGPPAAVADYVQIVKPAGAVAR